MTLAPLPTFRYHPDPVGTGEVRAGSGACRCCGRQRRYLYTGPVYGQEQLHDLLCPWCIADGTAAVRFGATFFDIGWGISADVAPAVLDELSHRTPSFTGWQQEHWLYHCDDAAAYLGRASYQRLRRHPDALEMLLHENDDYGWSEAASSEWVRQMSTEGSPTAYLFRCLHCHADLAYADMD
ncbi:MAG TPA: CbrC family protein [Acidimicrobiales bacterium]|nr:CbrC family protein [Acidimicrobiales bacterium]